jgi:tetratricopeptide (TPR) repeat protein
MPIAERALLLDPLSVLPHMNIGIIHVLAGDQPRAEAQFRHVLAMNPTFLRALLFLGASVGLQGKYDESIRIMTELVERGNRSPFYVWALVLATAMAGRTREARDLLASIDQSKFPGLAERSDWMYSLERQPFLTELHGEPRFQAVLAKLGLPSH